MDHANPCSALHGLASIATSAVCGNRVLLSGQWLFASEPLCRVLVRWRQLSDTLGRKVRVVLPSRSFEGIAQDVDSQGELIVDGTVVTAGSLIHLTR